MLAVSGGVAWATTGSKSGGTGSAHSATHSATHDAAAKPTPAHHRDHHAKTKAKSAAAKADPRPVATSVKHDTVSPTKAVTGHKAPTAADAAAAKPTEAKTAGTETPDTKTVKTPKTSAAATLVSAVTTASSASTPSTPSTPSLPDSATVAALGEEVQRKSTQAAQLSPGYLVNSVVNTVGAALAGTAAHLSSALAYDVQQATQWTRQMVGLGFDVSAMVASLVNNIAVLGARDVGPSLLWGLPYNALNAVAVVAGDVSKVLTGTPLNATGSGPFAVNYGVYNLLGYLMPWVTPSGANDPSITVTAEHPLPIILINATATNQNYDWSVGAPALADAGYKVYTYNYGNNTSDPSFPLQSTANIKQSAEQLSAEVDMVLAQTGASQVILIGHSQGGGILPEYYLNNLGGASKVSQLIGIAPSNHGTNVDGLTSFLSIPILGTLIEGLVNQGGAAWLQQGIGSSLVQETYGNGDTRPGVIYDTIASTNDEVVTPYTQQALSGPNVTNIVVQNQDPGFAGGHLDVAVSYLVWQDVLGMLADNAAASPEQPAAAVA
jgi:pimeloyl-ACP methyl ester carboxylesterase